MGSNELYSDCTLIPSTSYARDRHLSRETVCAAWLITQFRIYSSDNYICRFKKFGPSSRSSNVFWSSGRVSRGYRAAEPNSWLQLYKGNRLITVGGSAHRTVTQSQPCLNSTGDTGILRRDGILIVTGPDYASAKNFQTTTKSISIRMFHHHSAHCIGQMKLACLCANN